ACRPALGARLWRPCNHTPRVWPHPAAPAQIPQEAWSWSDHACAPSRCAARSLATAPAPALPSAQALARPPPSGRPASHPSLACVQTVQVSAPEQGDNLGLRELAIMRRTEPVHCRFHPRVWHHLQDPRWQPELTVLGGFPARETDLLSPAAPAQRQENG